MNWRLSIWSLPLGVFLILPLVALALGVRPAQIASELAQPEARDALVVSLRTTSASVCLLVLFGLPIAWWLGRGKTRWRKPVRAVVEMPAVLPPAVAGVALLLAFGRQGVVGGWLYRHGIEVAFTPIAVVMAQVFVASPFFLRPAAEAFARQDKEVLEAASLDGATSFRQAKSMIWPMCGSGLIAGLILAWARALGEFGATLLFAGSFQGTTQTVPLEIYDAFETDLNRAIALGVILMAIAAVVSLVASFLVAE